MAAAKETAATPGSSLAEAASVHEMYQLYQSGRFHEALLLAERMLAKDPDNRVAGAIAAEASAALSRAAAENPAGSSGSDSEETEAVRKPKSDTERTMANPVGVAALIAAAKAEQNRARDARLAGGNAAGTPAKDSQPGQRSAPVSERSARGAGTAEEGVAKSSVAKSSVAKSSVARPAHPAGSTPAPSSVTPSSAAEAVAKTSGARAPKSDTESTVANPVGAAALIAAAKAEQNRAREARLAGTANAPKPQPAAQSAAKTSTAKASLSASAVGASAQPSPMSPADQEVSFADASPAEDPEVSFASAPPPPPDDHPANAENTVFRPAAVAAALSAAARPEAKPTRQNLAAQSHVLKGSRPSSDSTVIRQGAPPPSSRRPTPAAQISIPSEAEAADPSTGSGVSRVRKGPSAALRGDSAVPSPQTKLAASPVPPRVALQKEELPAALSWGADEDPIAGGALDGVEDRLDMLEVAPETARTPSDDDGPQLEVGEEDAPDVDASAEADELSVADDGPQLEVVDDGPQLEVVDDAEEPVPTSEEVAIDEAAYEGETEDEDEPRSQRVVMYECFLSSDYENALALAESVLAADAEDPMANAIIEECRAALRYRASVPAIASSIKDWTKLELDSRSAFVLSRIDGVTSVEMLLDMCGALQPAEVLHVIDELYKARIIDLIPG